MESSEGMPVMKKTRWLPWAALVLICVTAFGLPVSAEDKKKTKPVVDMNRVWPPPPQKARFKLLQIIGGEGDVVGKKKVSLLSRIVADESGPSYIHFSRPYALAGDRHGKLYVTDTQLSSLFVIDPKERTFKVFAADADVQLRLPLAVTVDSQDRVWVADGTLKSVLCYSPDEKLLLQFGTDPGTPTEPTPILERPTGVAVDERRQRVYVSDAKLSQIFVFNTKGKFLTRFGKAGFDPGELFFPGALLVDPSGRLYVVDTQNARVQIFDPEFNVLNVIGTRGDSVGSFARPKSIALDSQGHLYVTDAWWHNVQIFGHDPRVKDPNELSVLLFIGEGGTKPGDFQGPAGIYINQYDQIFVADQMNGRIQVFQFLGGDEEQKQ
jgi:DNA-binding beta-propeller fold protein YncE